MTSTIDGYVARGYVRLDSETWLRLNKCLLCGGRHDAAVREDGRNPSKTFVFRSECEKCSQSLVFGKFPGKGPFSDRDAIAALDDRSMVALNSRPVLLKSLYEKYGPEGGYPWHPIEKWRLDVACGDTFLGYYETVLALTTHHAENLQVPDSGMRPLSTYLSHP